MKKIYSGRGRVLILLSVLTGLAALNVQAQVSTAKNLKSTFVQPDLFQSAVFLKNNNVVENHTGQNILYYTRRDNINAFFTETGIFYKVSTITKDPGAAAELNKQTRAKYGLHMEDMDEKGVPVISSTVKMSWIGCNPHPQILAGAKSNGYYTYIKNTDNGYISVSTTGYKTITYKELYPGIDAEYSFPEKGGIKYNLVVHAGADLSKVKINYAGKEISLQKDEYGNVVIHTLKGDLVEHSPVSFSVGGKEVPSGFVINEAEITFNFPSSYDNRSILTIDPWVTALSSLPPDNMGMDVDYDFAGNLLVYGAGPANDGDVNNNFQVAKYGSSGNFLWNFNGIVPVINWNTSTDFFYILPSNFSVDKVTGKIYMGKALDTAGTTVIRLTPAGMYDNFVSAPDTLFKEDWGILYNCSANSILALGGGTSSNINMGVVNTGTGTVTKSNFTGIPFICCQDIVCGTYDSSGNLYVIMNSSSFALPYINTLYEVNTSFTGTVWTGNATFGSFNEANNDPFWDPVTVTGANGNWFNALAANGQYLFYYDGFNLQAYSLSTGAAVGGAYAVNGNTVLMQGGMAADNCNHVYVGGQGKVLTFTFNGAAFVPGAAISLGGPYSADGVNDIKYNSTNNLLYVTGNGFAGTYNAALSTNCNVSSYRLSTLHDCDTATVHISPAANLNPKIFTIIWTDSAGNIISQLSNTPDTINTITGLQPGTYNVQVQWNINCGGTAISDSVVISTTPVNISVKNDTICSGGNAVLKVTPSISGATYLWSPGGYTTDSINVTATSNTLYSVTCTTSCGTASAAGSVIITSIPVSVTVNNDTICSGGNATLTAAPSVTGGTYSWSPGGYTSQSIHVTATSNTVYTVTYTTSCGTASSTGSVIITTITPNVAVNNDTICSGGNAALIATSTTGGGSYSWSPGAYTTDTIHVTATVNTAYTVTYTTSCGTATGTGSVIITTVPVSVTVNNDTICAGISGSLIATPSIQGGTYTWAPGGYTTGTITISPPSTTTYTVTYSTSCGTGTGTGTVTVGAGPTELLSQTPTTCALNNGSILVTAGGGTSPYQFSLNGGAYQLPDSFNNLASRTYTIALKDSKGCSASDTISVSPSTTVSAILTSINPGCTGNNGEILVNASGGATPYQYSVNSGAAQAQDSFTNLIPGTYIVKVTDANACFVADTTTLQPRPPLSVSLAGDSIQCFGGADGQLTATASGGAPSYEFTLNGLPPQNTGTFTNLPVGSYTVIVTDQDGCTATASDTLYQPAKLVFVSITATAVLCIGDKNGTVTVVAAGGAQPYNYSVTQDFTNFVYATNGLIIGLDTGLYSVVLSDAHGCTLTDTVRVPNAVPDSFSVTTDSTSCFGAQYHDGAVHIQNITSANLPYQYSLDSSLYQLSGDFYNVSAGTHFAEVQNVHGCITVLAPAIVGQPAPATLSILPSDTTLKLGASLNLTSYFGPYPGSSIVSYDWTPTSGLSCPNCPDPVVTTYATINTYDLIVTYNDGCTVEAETRIIITDKPQIFIPNSFSPNGDGNNDVFLIYGENIKTVALKIFNRWGEKVFESENQFEGWDGTYKGVIQNPAVFVYEATITMLDNSQVVRKGSLTLIR